ncbi:MAG: T9SS type A sorting domain-containing protein [Saprospiraceae bacterium]
MKKVLLSVIFFCVQSFIVGQIAVETIDSTIKFANEQMKNTILEMNDNSSLHPNQTNISSGRWEFSNRKWWISGFFAGVSWYMSELVGDNSYWLDIATRWTKDLESQKNDTGNHDVGFQIFCSYGNANRITPNEDYKNIIITAANSLASRYDETVGSIRSWSWGNWNYPVIVDNMMNLELLLWASENGGDEELKTIAIKHAKKTLENHIREDGSTYHIVDYNNDGSIKNKDTHQGYNIESTWSRGQAWGIYGFTMMYQYTKNDTFLTAAKKLSDYFIDNLPDDFVPYSDFKDPNIPNVSKDASAAAITCSALFELAKYVDDDKYKNSAVDILNSLVNNYLAKNSNYHSVIKRACVRSGDSERGLIYADYYFLEALMRYKNSVTSIKENEILINSHFELFQNYPNPFNPSTVINYKLAKDSFVKLNIYNSIGKKMSSYLNEKQSSGTHAFYFDATSYASGIYYYQLISNGFSQSKKMVILQ